jgi:hypothetical protein
LTEKQIDLTQHRASSCVRLGAIALVSLLSLAGGACSGADESLAGSDSEAGGANLTLTIGQAQRTMVIAQQAENTLVEQCLTKLGYRFPNSVNIPVPVVRIPELPFTPETAEHDGYGVYIDNEPPGSGGAERNSLSPAFNTYVDSLSPTELKQFMSALRGNGDEEAIIVNFGDGGELGLPMGGCTGDARRQLYGERVLEVFETFNTLQFLVPPSASDPKIQEKDSEWATCMKTAGFTYDSVSDAIEAGIALRGDQVSPPSQELTLATGDAKCRADTDYAATIEAHLAKRDAQLVVENEQLLTSWGELEQFVLSRSGQVLGVDLTSEP